MSDDILAATSTAGDDALDAALRPRKLDHFIGQAQVRDQLGIVLDGARGRGTPPDHMLFNGPPGLGKTSLANIVAAEMNATLRTTSGPALERPGDLAAILSSLDAGDVLFIDEIHRLPRVVEEILYGAMEDFRLDVVVGKGETARSVRLPLAPFTLVAATTRAGLMTSPLRGRFGFTARLDFYDADALAQIVTRSASLLGIEVAGAGAQEIGRRSRGTPRIANRLLKRVRDYAEVRADGVITEQVAADALRVFEVDERGLDKLDRAVLTAICRDFDGGPVGLSTLAAAVGEEKDNIEEVVEPFLIRERLLVRTGQGRRATQAAWEHLGIKPKQTGML